ncbi:MAG: LuxR C-terminal-related transcriptional regulator [bacterium]
MADLAAIAALHSSGQGIGASPVALLVVDDDGAVAEANLSACRLLGLARGEVQGRVLGELFARSDAERLDGVWRAFHQAGGHAGPFELASPGARDAVDISVTAAVLPGLHLVLLSPSPSTAGPEASDSDEGALARVPTVRERQILGMLASGGTDTQIAVELGLSPATVQTHVRNAKAKLGARTRAHAVAMVMRRGLIVAD